MELIIFCLVVIPIVMFPASLIWYINIKGALDKYRATEKKTKRILKDVYEQARLD